MKSLAEIATNSIAITLTNARTCVNLKNKATDNQAMLIANFNEAKGKMMMAFRLLHEMGKADEASRVLDYFNKEVAPDFQKMLKVNK